MKLVLFVFALLVTTTSVAEIYMWETDDGIVHFSDKHHPGAKVVTIEPVSVISMKSAAPKVALSSATETQSTTSVPYKSVEIQAPKSGQVVFKHFQAIVATNPALRSSDRIQVLLDGNKIGPPSKQGVFTISDISFGQHTVLAEIIGKNGQVLGRSKLVHIERYQPQQGSRKTSAFVP